MPARAVHDQPLSISEIAEISKNLKLLGELQEARSLLMKITFLPDIVLQETEDHWHTIEAAKLLADLGEKPTALTFLERLSGLSSEWDLKDISKAIGELTGSQIGEADALTVASSYSPFASDREQNPSIFDESAPLMDRLILASDVISKTGNR